MPLKILLIVPSYRPAYVYGGPIEAVSNLAESLVKRGQEVTVYTTNANGKEDLSVECGIPVNVDNVSVYYFKRITRGHSNFSPDLLRVLNKSVKTFDIIHIQSWWNLVAMPAAWICLKHKITPIISPRGTLTSYTFTQSKRLIKESLHRLAGKKWLKQSNLLFTSTREQSEALKYVQPLQTDVLPNIHFFPAIQPNDLTKEQYLDILFLGRIDPAKNLEFLLHEVTTHLKIPFQLTIAGTGDPEYVKTLKAAVEKDQRIKWCGKVEGLNKFHLLRTSDLLVLPSHTENYGNVILESLSQGTPVLISDQVGLKEYVSQHHLGWVEKTSEGSWARLLKNVWEDIETRTTIRNEAPERIAKDFNPMQEADRYIDYYTRHITNATLS
jgi:glycosyltransferase involved in cell wall biosynthesis